MSEDDKPEKPDPIEDVRKGLGLLFRAAKSAIDQLPTRHVEEAVVAGAREVGRAIENVTSTLDKQFFKRDAEKPQAPVAPRADAGPPRADAGAPGSPVGPESGSDPKPENGDGSSKGPRVG